MNKTIVAAVTALSVLGTAFAGVPAAAQDGRYRSDQSQYRDRDRDGRYDRQDYGERDSRYDRRDHRDGRDDRREHRQFRYYGGNYGYNGYQGNWRTGQRYPYYNQNRYVISDYGNYGLPAPRRGYRYYRDNNGDVVMAAIASGVIGLIIGGALSGNDGRHHRGY